mmetsp:Transcript_4620/g.11409  ORF Transcript_4620/g.11409 Transcript_4620/m.11409 type:complete len:248 (-) Transcript_4620:158-901(-)
MSHARLVVGRRPDGEALSEADQVLLLELEELPAHERVIERVHRSGDHGAAPVHLAAELAHVLHGQRREVAQPVVRIRKMLQILVGHIHRTHDLPLLLRGILLGDLGLGAGECQRVGLCRGLGRLFLWGDLLHSDGWRRNTKQMRFFAVVLVCVGSRRKGWIAMSAHLTLDLVRRGRNRHASGVETERIESALALQTLVADHKVSLAQRESMAQMQTTIHVRIRKGGHEFAFSRGLGIRSRGINVPGT